MKREEAIEKLARIELRSLSNKERIQLFEPMIILDWSENEDWNLLSEEIREEIKTGEFKEDLFSERYDDVLIIAYKMRFKQVSNNYLKSQLGILIIEEDTNRLVPCPCCGYRTLRARNVYNVCFVCWWEDEGQDNENASEKWFGPNDGISLTQARINFINHGHCYPKTKQIFIEGHSKNMYDIGRKFEIINDEYIIEAETNWKEKINE